jgi:hypothetical protein
LFRESEFEQAKSWLAYEPGVVAAGATSSE